MARNDSDEPQKRRTDLAAPVDHWRKRRRAFGQAQGCAGTWLANMLARKPPMLVIVALANKMARVAWALMTKGGIYCAPAVAA